MRRFALLTSALLILCGIGAQSQSSKQQPSNPPSNNSPSTNPDDILNSPMTPPRSDTPANKPAADTAPKNSGSDEFPFPESEEKPGPYSSSKESRGDISPPANDASHPGGDVKVEPNDGGITEMKPWNPHEADKDIEVGVFYFKRGNYKAAEARFRHALNWMDNNAEANYRLATVLDKEGKHTEARQYYQAYLKILPKGEFATDSRKALSRSNDSDEDSDKTRAKKTATSPPS